MSDYIVNNELDESELFAVDAQLHVLVDTLVVVGEVVVFVLLEGPVHDFQQLLLSRVVDLPDFGLDLVEPVLDGVELRRVRRQVQDLHAALCPQVYRLLLIVDRTIIQD